MTRPKRPIIFFSTGLVFLLLLITCVIPGGLELRVTLVENGKPLLILPLDPGEHFTLHYYHSVENAPIWEVHSVDKEGNIYIEEERYLKFGAGMGRMPGVGRMVQRGPYEVIENMHWPTGNFILRVGSPGVNHTIIWRGAKKNLSHVVPHKAVLFSAKPVSLLGRIRHIVIPSHMTPRRP